MWPDDLIVGARLARGELGGDRDEPGDRLAAGQGDAIGILGGARSRDHARATGRDGSDVGAAAGAEGRGGRDRRRGVGGGNDSLHGVCRSARSDEVTSRPIRFVSGFLASRVQVSRFVTELFPDAIQQSGKHQP